MCPRRGPAAGVFGEEDVPAPRACQDTRTEIDGIAESPRYHDIPATVASNAIADHAYRIHTRIEEAAGPEMSTRRIKLGHKRSRLPVISDRETAGYATSTKIDPSGIVACDRHVPATIDRNGASDIQSAVREVLGPLMDAR